MTARLSRRISRVSLGESFDETGQVTFNPDSPQIKDQRSLEGDEQSNKKLEEEKRKRILSSTPSNLTPISSFEKAPIFGLASCLTLKVLIFDFGLSLADVLSDFAQVCHLHYYNR